MTPFRSDMRHSNASNVNFTSLADASATLYMLDQEDLGLQSNLQDLHTRVKPESIGLDTVAEVDSENRYEAARSMRGSGA